MYMTDIKVFHTRLNNDTYSFASAKATQPIYWDPIVIDAVTMRIVVVLPIICVMLDERGESQLCV